MRLAGSIKMGMVDYIALVSELSASSNFNFPAHEDTAYLVQGVAQASPWEPEVPKFPRCINSAKPPGLVN